MKCLATDPNDRQSGDQNQFCKSWICELPIPSPLMKIEVLAQV